MDRDTKFCESFRDFLGNEGIEAAQLPPKSPNLNAHLERFMRSIKSECLDRMIFFGEKSGRPSGRWKTGSGSAVCRANTIATPRS